MLNALEKNYIQLLRLVFVIFATISLVITLVGGLVYLKKTFLPSAPRAETELASITVSPKPFKPAGQSNPDTDPAKINLKTLLKKQLSDYGFQIAPEELDETTTLFLSAIEDETYGTGGSIYFEKILPYLEQSLSDPAVKQQFNTDLQKEIEDLKQYYQTLNAEDPLIIEESNAAKMRLFNQLVSDINSEFLSAYQEATAANDDDSPYSSPGEFLTIFLIGLMFFVYFAAIIVFIRIELNLRSLIKQNSAENPKS